MTTDPNQGGFPGPEHAQQPPQQPPYPSYWQQPANPPSYPPVPGVGGYYPPPPRTNGTAVASFACSLAGFFICPPAAIAGVICGHIARGQIRRTGENGASLALAGLIIGYAYLVLLAIFLVIFFVAIRELPGTV